jgi:hypothetical protein
LSRWGALNRRRSSCCENTTGSFRLFFHGGQPDGPVFAVVNPEEETKAVDRVFEEGIAHIAVGLHGKQVAVYLIKV